MKKILSLVLSVTLLIGFCTYPVHAQETVYPKVFHTYTMTEDFASDEWTSAQRGAYLLDGMSCIARYGTNSIAISGDTTATQYVDKVVLTLFVERSTSYSTGYSTYKSYSYSANNVYQVAREVSNIPVERGYYYRVTGVHSVTHNGVIETTNSVTNPISYK